MNQSMNPTKSAWASSALPADEERASAKRVMARSLSRRGTRAANSATYRPSSSSAAASTPAPRGFGVPNGETAHLVLLAAPARARRISADDRQGHLLLRRLLRRIDRLPCRRLAGEDTFRTFRAMLETPLG